jgi:hypothetical protein
MTTMSQIRTKQAKPKWFRVAQFLKVLDVSAVAGEIRMG